MPLLSSRYALTHLLMSFVDGESFQVFLGHVIATSAGTHIYLKHGWRAGAGLSLGLVGCMFLIVIVRGPQTRVNDMMGDGNPPSSDDDNSKADIQEVVKDTPLRAEERGTDRRAKDQPNYEYYTHGTKTSLLIIRYSAILTRTQLKSGYHIMGNITQIELEGLGLAGGGGALQGIWNESKIRSHLELRPYTVEETTQASCLNAATASGSASRSDLHALFSNIAAKSLKARAQSVCAIGCENNISR